MPQHISIGEHSTIVILYPQEHHVYEILRGRYFIIVITPCTKLQ